MNTRRLRITASAILVVLFLCWLSGFNFDTRGGQAFSTAAFAIVVGGLIYIAPIWGNSPEQLFRKLWFDILKYGDIIVRTSEEGYVVQIRADADHREPGKLIAAACDYDLAIALQESIDQAKKQHLPIR